MARILAFLLPLLCAVAQRFPIDYFEVRNGRLFVTIEGQPRIVSTGAIAAWQGWAPQVVIYTEQAGAKERIRWYDSFLRTSQTIGVEDLHVADVATVRLTSGDYAILLALREPGTNMPSVALATQSGVFHREHNATYGTAANDAVEIRRYDSEELERTKGNVTLLKPAVSVSMPLIPKASNAAGIYETTLPAADAATRSITLNLRSDGTALMVTAFDGKGDPIAKRGAWKQDGFEVRLELEGSPDVLVWSSTVDGLVPKSWNRQLYGATGLRLPKAEAQMSAPRRAPGTTR